MLGGAQARMILVCLRNSNILHPLATCIAEHLIFYFITSNSISVRGFCCSKKVYKALINTLTTRLMGPTLGRQDPSGPHVGHMNFAIWVSTSDSILWDVIISPCLSYLLLAQKFSYVTWYEGLCVTVMPAMAPALLKLWYIVMHYKHKVFDYIWLNQAITLSNRCQFVWTHFIGSSDVMFVLGL